MTSTNTEGLRGLVIATAPTGVVFVGETPMAVASEPSVEGWAGGLEVAGDALRDTAGEVAGDALLATSIVIGSLALAHRFDRRGDTIPSGAVRALATTAAFFAGLGRSAIFDSNPEDSLFVKGFRGVLHGAATAGMVWGSLKLTLSND